MKGVKMAAVRTEAEPRHHGLHLPPKIFLPVAAVLAGLGALYIASSRQGEPSSPVIDNNPVSDSFKPPEPPQVPEIPVIVSQPPEQTQPDKDKLSPQKPDNVETTPCLITSPELCAQGERIQIVRSRTTETYITLNPDKKISFFVPEDGVQLLDKVKESGDPFSGFTAILRKPAPGGAYIIIGLEFDNMLQIENPKNGALIGSSADKTINFGAKILVTITKRTPNGPVTDEEALRRLFPDAFEAPIKATYMPGGPGKPNVSNSYAPTPPQ